MNPQATTTTSRTREVILGALEAELDVTAVETEYRNHARELARGAAAEGYELVLSLGGDGTVNEVVNGLVAGGRPADEAPVFAPIPAGSTNGCATGSSPRHAATPWRCWSCRRAHCRRNWPAGSSCPTC